MGQLSEDLSELEDVLSGFMFRFRNVFEYDWDCTKANMGDPHFIAEDGTFLRPNVEDESDNWGNRGGLLSSYRELIAVMEKHGIAIDAETPAEGDGKPE